MFSKHECIIYKCDKRKINEKIESRNLSLSNFINANVDKHNEKLYINFASLHAAFF